MALSEVHQRNTSGALCVVKSMTTTYSVLKIPMYQHHPVPQVLIDKISAYAYALEFVADNVIEADSHAWSSKDEGNLAITPIPNPAWSTTLRRVNALQGWYLWENGEKTAILAIVPAPAGGEE